MFGRVGLSTVSTVGLAVILAACMAASPSPPPTSPTATTQASQPPEPSPTPVSTAAPTAWSSLAWSAGVSLPGGQFVSDLIPWGDGYVGVGRIETDSGLDVAFFSSSDGAHWSLASHLSTGGRNVQAAHVVRLGDRLLAVGQAVVNGPGEHPDFPPPLWTSGDGTTWTPLASPSWDAAFSSASWPAWLLAGPTGVVAVGSGTDPAIVSSTDGSTWTAVTLPATDRTIALDATTWSGGFVVVGRDGTPDRFSQAASTQPPPGAGLPAAWVSQDGVRWSEAAVPGEAVPGAELRYVVPVAGGLLGVGIRSTADYYAAALTSWTSSDGSSWSVAAGSGWPLGTTGYPMFAADGGHTLLLGRAPEGPTLAAWTTTDGVGWIRLTFDVAESAPPIDCGTQADCVRIDAAWLVPAGVIVAGTSISGNGGQRVWLATPIARLALPPLASRPQQPDCGGLTLTPPTILQGSPSDGVYALTPAGDRIPMHWTGGLYAEFSPGLAIRSEAGNSILAVEGDDLSDGVLGSLEVCPIAGVAGPFIEILYAPE